MNFYIRYRLLRLPWWVIGYYPDIEVRYVHFLKCNTCLIISLKQIHCKLTLYFQRTNYLMFFYFDGFYLSCWWRSNIYQG